MPTRLTVEVPDPPAGSRADRFVADASGLSRAYVQRLITEGRLTLDGRPVRARDTVIPGASLELDGARPGRADGASPRPSRSTWCIRMRMC